MLMKSYSKYQSDILFQCKISAFNIHFDQFDLVHVVLVGKSNEIHNLCSLTPKDAT